MKITTIISFVLVIVGALVWLSVGIFNFNPVAWLLGIGTGEIIARVVYSLVGVAALWLIFYWAAYRPFRTMN